MKCDKADNKDDEKGDFLDEGISVNDSSLYITNLKLNLN